MTVRVKLFAAARDLVGGSEVELDLPHGATIADVRRALARLHPALANALPSALFAVNREYAADTRAVSVDSEIALIPPVSGG